MILAGDIGGTKTNLALFEMKDDGLVIKHKAQFPSQNYAHFEEVIEAFMTEHAETVITLACFGIAGPVIDGVCHTTNLPWQISAEKLKNELQIESVSLLNDLEATAYGMLYLNEDEFVDLNLDAVKREGNRAVIAAGTGLGEAMLFYDGTSYHPMASEGGHCDFAPLTEAHDGLLRWLRQRFPEHVSYERILSGPGVYTLYEYLLERDGVREDTALDFSQGTDRSAKVSEYALKQGEPRCLEALRLFALLYGAEASNLALKSLSRGGVYVGGGIAPKILPILQEPYFLEGFLSKGRFNPLLSEMSIRVALNDQTALLGAAYFARDRG